MLKTIARATVKGNGCVLLANDNDQAQVMRVKKPLSFI